MTRSRHLTAVLHSLPPGSGALTLNRVELARQALGCDAATVTNLYPAVLASTGALPDLSVDPIWDAGRQQITAALDQADTTDVLLGYGVTMPSGTQRANFSSQLAWLSTELKSRDIAVWAFGDRPSHPSRWHRHVHRHAPESTIEDTITRFLGRYSLSQ